MADSNDTANTTLEQQLAVQILLAVGAAAQTILHPVADEKEALKLILDIKKTPGFFILGENSGAPIMFHVRHVVMTQTVLMPPKVAPPKLARIN